METANGGDGSARAVARERTRGGGRARERERGAGRRGDVQGGQSDEEGKQEVAGRRGHAAAPTGRSLKKLLAVGLGRPAGPQGQARLHR